MNKVLHSNEKYKKYVERKSPNSNMPKNCTKAFIVGGIICCIGQLIYYGIVKLGFNVDDSMAITSIILVFLGAFLTGINIYNKIGKFAGAGSIIPITGFANSIVAPAMEHRKEGLVTGVGAKMFVIAGPVLVYGIISSFICGLIYCFIK